MSTDDPDPHTNDLLEAMLHPVRLRALGALARGELTTTELTERLDGVAPSSLYRHMKALRDAGLVSFTERRPARGATERVYALARSARLSADDVAGLSGPQHARHFTTWALTLVDRSSSDERTDRRHPRLRHPE